MRFNGGLHRSSPLRSVRVAALLCLSLAACGDGAGNGNSNGSKAGGSIASPLRPTTADSLSCPTGTTLEGADVSYYDGTIDWAALKASGRTFAIARVADGSTYVDPTFATNWAAMKTNGFVRGAYQFFRADEPAAAQASLLLATMGPLDPDDLPPTLDLEIADSESAAVIVQRAQEWLAIVRAGTGREPIIYTEPGFWNYESGFPSLAWLGTLWIANWQVSCPTLATGFTSWQFWQYDDKGTAPGLGSDDADLDRFNGTLDDLHALAAKSTLRPGPIATVGEAWGQP